MAFIVGPNGRYWIGIHRVSERFTVQRMTEQERTEVHPDGRISHFIVTDNSDNSTITLDEEDADRLESLWRAIQAKEEGAAELEKHLTWIFDVQNAPESKTSS